MELYGGRLASAEEPTIFFNKVLLSIVVACNKSSDLAFTGSIIDKITSG